MSLDESVLQWTADHRIACVTWIGQAAADLSGRRPMAVIGVVVTVVLIAMRRFRVLITAAVAAGAALAVSTLLKVVIARPRPPAQLAEVPASGYSMPSTDSAVVAAGLLAIALTWPFVSTRGRTRAIWAAVVLATGVGLMTAYLGAHWLTDVLVGLPLGFALALITDLAGRRIRPGTAAPSSARAVPSTPPVAAPIRPEGHRDH